MKKILLPIDGSPRSLRAIQAVKQTYNTDEVEVTILMVTPEPRPSKLTDENDEVKPVEEHVDVVVDPQTAEREACRMEHTISQRSFELLKGAVEPE